MIYHVRLGGGVKWHTVLEMVYYNYPEKEKNGVEALAKTFTCLLMIHREAASSRNYFFFYDIAFILVTY